MGKATTRDGLYRRGRIWWVRTDPISGHAESTKCNDLEAARRWRAARERLAADPAHAAAATARLGHWIRELVRVKQQLGRSAATIEVCEQKLGHWARIFGVDAALISFDTDRFDAYVKQRRQEGAGELTISREADMLIAALRLAKRARCYPYDLETLRPPDLLGIYRPRSRALTEAELRLLLAELPPRRAAFVQLAVGFGLRRSEVYRVQPSDVDPKLLGAFIDGTKTPGSKRQVPILSLFRDMLEAAVPHLPVEHWPNLSRDLDAACDRAGIPHCTPNDLRRTFATWCAEAGIDPDTVRRFLGHTTDAMVKRIYARPRMDKLAAIAELSISSTQHLRDSGEGEASVSAEPPSRFELETYGLRNRTQGGQDSGESAKTAEKASADDPEGPPVTGADATKTLHPKHPAYPPAVWALALAAGRVLSRRTFLVEGTIRKGARRAG